MLKALVIELPELEVPADFQVLQEYRYKHPYQMGNVQPQTYIQISTPSYMSPDTDKTVSSVEVFLIDAKGNIQLFKKAGAETTDNSANPVYKQAPSRKHVKWKEAHKKGLTGTRVFTRVPDEQAFVSELTSGIVDKITFEKNTAYGQIDLVLTRIYPERHKKKTVVERLAFSSQGCNLD